MFGQTTLKSKPKSDAKQDQKHASVELRHDVAELGADLVELIELQFQLLIIDLSEGKWRAITTLVLGVVAMLLFLGSLPVLLFGAGWLLAVSTELTMSAAFTIVGGSALLISALLAVVAYLMVARIGNIFKRSRHELKSSLRWLKYTLKTMS